MAINGHDNLHARLAALEQRWTDLEAQQPPTTASMKGGESAGLTGFVSRIAMSTQLQGNQFRIANPGPLGLLAFGYTTIILQGYNTKWTEAGVDFWAYSYAIFYGGLAQFCAGMWEIYRNNVFGATAFSSYGAFWMGFGLLGILASGGVFEGPAAYPEGTQMAFCLWGIITFGFFLVALVINVALTILFLALAITFFLLAAGQTGHPRCTKAGGYFAIFTAAVAWYTAFSELSTSVYRRTILPLGVINIATKEPSQTGVARPDTL